MAAKVATVSAGRGELEWSRKRRDTSSRGIASRPHERQMDTALVDQADWKLSLGPTCTAKQAAEMPSSLLMQSVDAMTCHSKIDCLYGACSTVGDDAEDAMAIQKGHRMEEMQETHGYTQASTLEMGQLDNSATETIQKITSRTALP